MSSIQYFILGVVFAYLMDCAFCLVNFFLERAFYYREQKKVLSVVLDSRKASQNEREGEEISS